MSSVSAINRTFSTELPSEVTNLQWKIGNFMAMVNLVKPLEKAHLKFDAGHSINLPTTWKLRLITQNVASGKLGVSLKLLESGMDRQEVFFMYEVLVKYSDGTVFKRSGPETPQNMKAHKWQGFSDVVGPLSKIPSSGVLEEGCLFMDIKFELFSFCSTNDSVINVEDHTQEKIARLHEKSKNLVLNDLQKLLEKGTKSDFKIVMEDGKTFLVHKNILDSRSPVFLAMLIKAASTGAVQVIVDDLSSKAMEIVLKFIYWGNVDKEWTECFGELLYAARKYSLNLLQEFCDIMLWDAASSENATDLSKLARKLKLETAERELKE